MKSAKKIVSVLLAAFMTIALVGCGEDGKNRVVDDTSVLGMSFTPPKEFETVQRSVEKTADGKLVSKTILYKLSDERTIAYAVTDAEGHKLEDELGETKVERKEYNGKELILYSSGKKTRMAFYQDGENVYGVQYKSADTETIDDELDKMLQQVTFSDKKETALNDIKLDKIKYSTETDIPVYSESTDMEEKPDGTVVSKKFIWKYSQDSETIDYRFGIEEYKDAKLADILKEDKEYEELKIGGVTYSVEKSDKETDTYDYYNYYVQQGDNVYVIQNKGISNGWFVSRSEESKKAFETFINSVKF